MIGKVSGRLDSRGEDHVLVDTGGVAYVVYCSERTLAAMPAPGERIALYTELVVREDLMQLFGFRTRAERECHRLLTSVQGIGAKGALAVLGALGAEGVSRALSLGDAAAIRAAPGIGPKIAQRLVNELQSKAPAIMAMGAAGAEPAFAASTDTTLVEVAATPAPAAPQAPPGNPAAQADALSALVNLGYAHGEAASAIAEATGQGETPDAQALIRAALRALAPKG